MIIETLDDIIQEYANRIGVYGCCKHTTSDGCQNTDPLCCRVGFTIEMDQRIRQAIANEEKLATAGF